MRRIVLWYRLIKMFLIIFSLNIKNRHIIVEMKAINIAFRKRAWVVTPSPKDAPPLTCSQSFIVASNVEVCPDCVVTKL